MFTIIVDFCGSSKFVSLEVARAIHQITNSVKLRLAARVRSRTALSTSLKTVVQLCGEIVGFNPLRSM